MGSGVDMYESLSYPLILSSLSLLKSRAFDTEKKRKKREGNLGSTEIPGLLNLHKNLGFVDPK